MDKLLYASNLVVRYQPFGPDTDYEAKVREQARAVINSYGLALLNAYNCAVAANLREEQDDALWRGNFFWDISAATEAPTGPVVASNPADPTLYPAGAGLPWGVSVDTGSRYWSYPYWSEYLRSQHFSSVSLGAYLILPNLARQGICQGAR